jgi:hypothetical protein
MRLPQRYNLVRGGEVRAQIVVFSSGRCVVSWPTSTIVYDSEAAARLVHIEHMGGRGEETKFVPLEPATCFCGAVPFDGRCLELGCEAHHVPVRVMVG